MPRKECFVPEPIDFQATFGCACTIDQDLVQTCELIDQRGDKVRLTFGNVDHSFGLSLFRGDTEVFRLYDEFLFSVKIRETKQLVEVMLGDCEFTQTWEVRVWPEIFVSAVRKK